MAARMHIPIAPIIASGEQGMNKLKQDLRYALRQLRRSPGFAAVAIFTLALGIGANTAIFSVLDSILLQPLPFPHARPAGADRPADRLFSFPKGWVREYQRRATTFSFISGYTLNTEYNVTGGSVSDRAFGSTVSTNLFDTLGVRPSLGRSFSAAEERSWSGSRRHPEPRVLAAALRRRWQRPRQENPDRRRRSRDHRRRARRYRLS